MSACAREGPDAAVAGVGHGWRRNRDRRRCPVTAVAGRERTGIASESAAAKAGGGQYADVTKLFCTADRCPVIAGNTLAYLDGNHLTVKYSRLLAPVMGALAIVLSPTVDMLRTSAMPRNRTVHRGPQQKIGVSRPG